jgi:hypothetical protein
MGKRSSAKIIPPYEIVYGRVWRDITGLTDYKKTIILKKTRGEGEGC